MSIQQYAVRDGRELNNRACALAAPLTVRELAGRLGLDLSGTAERGSARIARVCLDSRAAGPASLFVALKGARADGHAFLAEVAAAGCVAALVSAEFAGNNRAALEELERVHGLTCLVVADPLAALQEWAAGWLAGLRGLVRIGVTGSNGKTTTKELLQSVLGPSRRLFASPGNLNSVIGLPLAALAVEADTEVAVFEMAMSEAGEMGRLARIVFPDLAIVTNVGTAHIGNIGSQEAIAREKKQIFSTFTARGTAFIPGDDPFAGLLAEAVPGTVIRFGENHTEGYRGWEASADGQIILWGGEAIHLAAAGRHLRSDALAVISLASHVGLPPAEIRAGLEAWRPAFGRNELLEGRVRVIQDCYNANPDSMKAAIEAFGEQPAGSGGRGMVLGDMRELGGHSNAAHAEIGRLLAAQPLDALLFFGPDMAAAWESWRRAGGQARRGAAHCGDFDELVRKAGELFLPGDLVLLKASRGMELERLTPVLTGPAAAGTKD